MSHTQIPNISYVVLILLMFKTIRCSPVLPPRLSYQEAGVMSCCPGCPRHSARHTGRGHPSCVGQFMKAQGRGAWRVGGCPQVRTHDLQLRTDLLPHRPLFLPGMRHLPFLSFCNLLWLKSLLEKLMCSSFLLTAVPTTRIIPSRKSFERWVPATPQATCHRPPCLRLPVCSIVGHVP